jgi:hypothetical protein
MRQMLEEMPVYLCKMIMDRYQAPACAPFEKIWLWPNREKPQCAVFEGFVYGKGSLVIDIYCSATQFLVQLFDRNSDDAAKIVKQALNGSGLFDGFRFDENARRYVKVFEFPSEETALFAFIDKQVLPRFRALKAED